MSNRHNVLLMVRELNLGGCERDLARTAIALKGTEFYPVVACFRDEGFRRQELDAAGIEVITIPVRSLASKAALEWMWKLSKMLRTRPFDIVHAFDVPSAMFAGLAAPLAPKSRFLAAQLSYRATYLPREQALMWLADRTAHTVVVNSQAVAEDLVTNHGVRRDKIQLVYNGVDPNEFSPGDRVTQSPLVIGTVAALRPEKRLELLVEAFARVHTAMPDTKLVIVGSGSVEPALRQQAQSLGIADACHFEPATREVPRWLRSIDVFVSTSETESFSNSILEALACRCCVVASRVGGTPEMVEDQQSGLLFPSGDVEALANCLLAVCRDPELRERLAQAGCERAHQMFSLQTNLCRTQELYRSVLA
jgi:glycosyltransferase involved in cell wall biosynthesis